MGRKVNPKAEMRRKWGAGQSSSELDWSAMHSAVILNQLRQTSQALRVRDVVAAPALQDDFRVIIE